MSSSGFPAGAQVGFIPPPPGVTPNFVDPPRNNIPFNSTLVTLVLAMVFVSIRFVANIFIVREFGWDDASCLLATAFAIAYAVSNFELVHLGMGIDLWNIPFEQFDITAWYRWNYVQDLIYSFVIGFVKVSILLLYLKLFKVKKTVRVLVFGMITVIALYTIIITFLTIFACHPINKLWDLLPGGYCLNSAAVGIALGALQIISDFVILGIPVPIVFSLQLPTPKKIAILIVFASGIVVTIASCVRMAILIQTYVSSPDINLTGQIIYINMWTSIEAYLALIISCMPAIRTLIWRMFPVLRSAYSRRYGGSPSPQQASDSRATRGSRFLRGGRSRHARDGAITLGSEGSQIDAIHDNAGAGRGEAAESASVTTGEKETMSDEIRAGSNEKMV